MDLELAWIVSTPIVIGKTYYLTSSEKAYDKFNTACINATPRQRSNTLLYNQIKNANIRYDNGLSDLPEYKDYYFKLEYVEDPSLTSEWIQQTFVIYKK